MTVPHDKCDLTGVGLSYLGYPGAVVTDRPGTVGNSSGFQLTVTTGLDVYVSWNGDVPTAPPGPGYA
jgi:hypothetical protein